MRFDLATRKLDTAAFTKVMATRLTYIYTDEGTQVVPVLNPLQVVDGWAMLPGGTIAILRGDHHADFIDTEGTRSSDPHVPFNWRRLTDSAKVALIDSARAGAE